MNRWISSSLFAFAILGAATVARAEPPRSMRLEYLLEGGAERCPAEQFFRDTVGRGMLFDPFVKDAPTRLVVRVTYRAGIYYGRAELYDGTSIVWNDPVKPHERDCRTVIHTLGVAVKLEIDPPGRERTPAPVSTPLPAQPPPAAAPLAPGPRPVQRAPTAGAPVVPLRVRCGLTGAFALWIAPSDLAFEGAVDCGLRWKRFSISTELRGSPPAGEQLPLAPRPGTNLRLSTGQEAAYVRSWRLATGIVPCMHWQVSERWNKPTFLGCAVVQGGGVFGSGLGLEGDPAMFYLASGGRFAFEIDIVDDVMSARAAYDLLGVLSRPVLSVVERTVWDSRPYSMVFGFGLGAFF